MAQAQKTPGEVTTAKDRKSLMPVIRDKLKNLSDYDMAAVEDEIGMLLDDDILERGYEFENYLYCVFLAVRGRLEDEGITLSTPAMLGRPGGKSLMRGLIRVLWDKSRGANEYLLRLQVPPETKTLPLFAGFVKDAVAQVIKEDCVLDGGSQKPPVYKVVGAGKNIDSSKGHASRVVQKIQARYPREPKSGAA